MQSIKNTKDSLISLSLCHSSKQDFLDSGHSLSDPGTSHKERVESLIVMRIRDLLIPLLKYNHFDVEVVPDNLNLRKSIDWINERVKKVEDGFAFALHINFGGGQGGESWYYKNNENSRQLAQDIIDAYTKEVGMENRGPSQALILGLRPLGFIDQTNCWAILIEMGVY